MPPNIIPSYHRANRNAFARWFGRTLLRLMGWRIEGCMPDIRKVIVAGAPHTSNWDFVITMSAVLALDVKANWLAKHTLFESPLRRLFFALGGIPLDRSKPEGVVEQVADRIGNSEQIIIGIMPEGTRSKVDKWKSGFLRMAGAARCPVLLASLDYSDKRMRFGKLIEADADIDRQLVEIKDYYRQFQPRHPEKF